MESSLTHRSEFVGSSAKYSWLLDRTLSHHLNLCGAKRRLLLNTCLFIRAALILLCCISVYRSFNFFFLSWFIAIPAGLLAYFLPILLVSFVVNRKVQLMREIPTLLNLLKVFVTTSSDTKGAIARIGREISDSCPVLSAEIDSMCWAAGATSSIGLGDDLRKLAERLELQELTSFSEAVIAGELKGIDMGFLIDQESSAIQNYWRNRQESKHSWFPVRAILIFFLFGAPLIAFSVLAPALVTCICSLGPVMASSRY